MTENTLSSSIIRSVEELVDSNNLTASSLELAEASSPELAEASSLELAEASSPELAEASSLGLAEASSLGLAEASSLGLAEASSLGLAEASSNTSQLICCICYDTNNDDNPHCEKMFTQCGHYFHKACYARANRKKQDTKCPYCQIICPIIYENKYYVMVQLRELSIEHYAVIKNITKIMRELYVNEYTISGSFAVHLHQMLHHKKPQWSYNDIDIYLNYDFSKNIGSSKQTKNYILMEMKENKKYSNFSSSNMFQYNSKYGIYLKKKESDIKIELKQILLLDLVKVNTTNPSKIISSFDLDCCKISITISDNIIKFYIHNDFYVDSYTIQNSYVTTINRVIKYRNRGFNCYNLENYPETVLDT
jgi:hypothetical protein